MIGLIAACISQKSLCEVLQTEPMNSRHLAVFHTCQDTRLAQNTKHGPSDYSKRGGPVLCACSDYVTAFAALHHPGSHLTRQPPSGSPPSSCVSRRHLCDCKAPENTLNQCLINAEPAAQHCFNIWSMSCYCSDAGHPTRSLLWVYCALYPP